MTQEPLIPAGTPPAGSQLFQKWPEILPLPERDGYQLKLNDGVMRTSMEGGPPRARRVTTDVESLYQARFVFDEDQFLTFQAWFQEIGAGGAAAFLIPLRNGLGLVEQQARFAGPYEARLDGHLWRVTVSLVVRGAPMLSGEMLELVLAEPINGLINAIDQFSILVHATLPDHSIFGLN